MAKLIEAAAGSRNPERDRCLLLLAYRHGFLVSGSRNSAACPLDRVDVEGRVLHVKRLTRGLSTTHPLRAEENRSHQGMAENTAADKGTGPGEDALISEQRKPLHRSTVNLLLKTAAPPLPCPSRRIRTCCAACYFAPSDQGAAFAAENIYSATTGPTPSPKSVQQRIDLATGEPKQAG